MLKVMIRTVLWSLFVIALISSGWWLKLRLRDVALANAVAAGNATQVSRLLNQGVNPETDANQGWGFTTLHLAAMHGNLQITQMLVESGANINAPSTAGLSPLWMALREGHLEVVRFLIAKGADVNVKDKEHGETARIMITRRSQHTPKAVKRYKRQRRPIYTELIRLLMQAEQRERKTKQQQDNKALHPTG